MRFSTAAAQAQREAARSAFGLPVHSGPGNFLPSLSPISLAISSNEISASSPAPDAGVSLAAGVCTEEPQFYS